MLPDHDVSLRDLRLVHELAQRRSFTEAAGAVHLSQSALSRAVNDVERRLGTRLFHRTTRSVTPTPVGAEFVRAARSILDHHERRLREFVLYRDGLGGLVRVATLPSVAATVLPPLVATLKREAPDVVVDIDDTLAHVAVEHLLAGRVDFAITVAEGLPEGTRFTPLVSDRFRLVFRADHRFHGRSTVRWAELAGEPVVRFGHASSIRSLTDATIERLGIVPGQAVEAQNVPVIAGLVAAGLGVAAIPSLVVALTRFADLESAELVEPEVDRTLGLVSVTGRPMSPAAERLIRTVAGIDAAEVWPAEVLGRA